MNARIKQHWFVSTAAWLILVVAWVSTAPAKTLTPTIEVSNESVAQAKQRMVRFLLTKQNAQTGAWETRSASDTRYYGHTTALVTYSLLQSGLTYQASSLTKALELLSGLQQGDAYTLYPRLLCWSVLPEQFAPQMEQDARRLVRIQQNGLFYDSNQVEKQVDTRLLLYGAIGLHVASERGITISAKSWESITNHLLGSQLNSGGWGNTDARSADTSLEATISAMTVLHLCRLHLAQYANAAGPITSSLERAERFLARNLTMSIAPNSFDKTRSYEAALYGFYQLELLTRYSGVQTYSGQDWFRQGVQSILELESGTGSIRGDMIETAFGLLFLSQVQTSVWLNYLEVPSTDAAATAQDVYQLTRSISHLREYDLHWQVVRPNDPLMAWLTAPILYVSSDLPIDLTTEQKGRLKRYLQMGGLLVAKPHKNSRAFSKSIVALMAELYPDLKFEPLTSEHPALSLLQKTEGLSLEGISNGVRDIVILAKSDLQIESTAENASGVLNSGNSALALWYNLYALATGRGLTTSRIDSLLEVPTDKPARQQWSVIRTTCSESKDGSLESMAWPLYGARLRNRAGIELAIHDLPLADIGAAESALVHLSGTNAQTLTDSQKKAIHQYIQRGGTLLVESIGGTNDFAYTLRPQLEALFEAKALPLAVSSDVYAQWPKLNIAAIARTPYRHFTVIRHGYKPFPRLTGLEVDGRQAILFTDDDLTMGLLRIQRWGISGYRPDAAEAIATHLLAWTSGHTAQLRNNASESQAKMAQNLAN